MEKINLIKAYVVGGTGVIGSMIVNLLGGWTKDLTTLLILIGVDFVMGLLIAGVWKKSNKSETGQINSYSAWRGLVRKGTTLLVVLVAHRLDVTLGMDYIKTMVVISFIANESISIIENAGIMGVPLPSALRRSIEILTKKAEEDV